MHLSPISPAGDFTRETNWSIVGEAVTNFRGYVPRDWGAQPLGSLGRAQPFPESMRIPVRHWGDFIRERDEKKLWLRDTRRAKGYGAPHQGRTNYCWAWSVVSAMQLVRARQGNPWRELSPASVAAPVTNYRNVGGWPGDALDYIADYGCVPADIWPQNRIDRSEQDNAAAQSRVRYKALEWYDLEANDWEAMGSCILRGMPLAVGRLAWSHATCSHRLVQTREGITTEDMNSWPGWGDDNDGVLPIRLAQRFEDALALVSVTSTEEPMGAAA